MNYSVQVERDHYFRDSYFTHDRWASYWYQIFRIKQLRIHSVLEIGVGNGIVADTLKKFGMEVTSLDIDPALKPDIIGSVIAMPVAGGSFDLVLAAEILEHIRWDDLPTALSEIHRVTKGYALITLPHSGYTFSMMWKFPLLSWKFWIWKLPHFWKTHTFNGEHYWELGKKGFSVSMVKTECIKAGFAIMEARRHADDPAHYHFLLKKTHESKQWAA